MSFLWVNKTRGEKTFCKRKHLAGRESPKNKQKWRGLAHSRPEFGVGEKETEGKPATVLHALLASGTTECCRLCTVLGWH
jgi:hypothetical protein